MEGDSSAAGPKYVRLTGGIVENLREEERQGRSNLPPKFGNQQHRDVTLPRDPFVKDDLMHVSNTVRLPSCP